MMVSTPIKQEPFRLHVALTNDESNHFTLKWFLYHASLIRMPLLLVLVLFSISARAQKTDPGVTGVYNLEFDISSYEVLGFADLRDKGTAIYAANRGTAQILLYDFARARKTEYTASQSSVEQTYISHDLDWTTWDWLSDKHQTFRSGRSRVTIVQNDNLDDVRQLGVFSGSCLDPASSYLRIERGGQVFNKVLLYVFPEPVMPHAYNRCEEELFSPPHQSVTLIDPILVAKQQADNIVLLAGRSYVSMPVVLVASDDFSIPTNDRSVYLVDKSAVDAARRHAVLEYKQKSRSGLSIDTGSSALAGLIETELLHLIHTRR